MQLGPGVMGEEMVGHKTSLSTSLCGNVGSSSLGSLVLRRCLSGDFVQIEGIDGLSVAKDKQFIALEIESHESRAAVDDESGLAVACSRFHSPPRVFDDNSSQLNSSE